MFLSMNRERKNEFRDTRTMIYYGFDFLSDTGSPV